MTKNEEKSHSPLSEGNRQPFEPLFEQYIEKIWILKEKRGMLTSQNAKIASSLISINKKSTKESIFESAINVINKKCNNIYSNKKIIHTKGDGNYFF